MQDNTITRYLGILIGTALLLALIPPKAATGAEPAPGEIPKLIEQLAGPDRDLVNDAVKQLKTNALPLLAIKLREGKTSERRVAAWAIGRITYYHGVGKNDPTKLVAALLEAASKDPVKYVRDYSAEALSNIKHDAAIGALIKLLSFKSDKTVARHACMGLMKNGARASKAVPALKHGILINTLPPEAFRALTAIQGKKAVPFIVRMLSMRKYGPVGRANINIALEKHPHPDAIPFMQDELWKGRASGRERAARFFAAMDSPVSLKHMRRCLNVLPKGKTELTHPNSTEVSTAHDIRTIAVRYLGRRRDTESYDRILEMLKTDLSLMVRTAAAEALGKNRYEKAIPALQACFALADGRHHGKLHTNAVQALANMRSEKAYRVIYDGIGNGHAKKNCIGFWRDTKDRTVFERFLGFFAKAPLDDKTAAGIIANQLRIHREHYAIPKKDAADARKRFLAGVRDPKHFGPGVDLSDKGKWKVSVGFAFYNNGFAKVSFAFSGARRRWHGRADIMLYRKQGNAWIPMARVGGYIE